MPKKPTASARSSTPASSPAAAPSPRGDPKPSRGPARSDAATATASVVASSPRTTRAATRSLAKLEAAEEELVRDLPQEVERNVPMTRLRPHPNNPNEGDIGAIVESIKHTGFYGALRVQRSTGFIVAGNHTYQALAALGRKTVPLVIWIECSDEDALRILVGDNEIAAKARRDAEALVKLLTTLANTGRGLQGVGADADDLDDMIAALQPYPFQQKHTDEHEDELPYKAGGEVLRIGIQSVTHVLAVRRAVEALLNDHEDWGARLLP